MIVRNIAGLLIVIMLLFGCTSTEPIISEGQTSDDIPRDELIDEETGEPIPIDEVGTDTFNKLIPLFSRQATETYQPYVKVDQENNEVQVRMYDNVRDDFFRLVEEGLTLSPRVEVAFVPLDEDVVNLQTKELGGETVRFLTLGSPDSREGLLEGELSLSEGGCLVVVVEASDSSTNRVYTILWPDGFDVVEQDGEIVVMDFFNDVHIAVGQTAEFGGGGPPNPEESIASFERDNDALPIEGCPQRYFSLGWAYPSS